MAIPLLVWAGAAALGGAGAYLAGKGVKNAGEGIEAVADGTADNVDAVSKLITLAAVAGLTWFVVRE